MQTTPLPPLAARLWAQTQLKAFQCLYHPFVASLARGSLGRDDFEAFLLQDAYFLHAFAQAFAFAATKTTTSLHTLAIVRRMSGIEQELRTHAAFLASFEIDLFHVTEATVAPATRAYVDFLLATAKHSDSVAEILAAMTPCMRLYAFLGQQIAVAAKAVEAKQSDPNPYQKWIDAYAPDTFEAAASDAEQHLDELAAFEGVAYETLMPLYNRAMELELRFFEQYFPVARAFADGFPTAVLEFPMTIHLNVTTTDAAWEDVDAIADLQPGQYVATIHGPPDATQFTLEIATVSQPTTSRAPLFATLLSPSASSATAAAQSKAELIAFLQTLSADGSFTAYAQPAAPEATRRVPRVLAIAGSDSGGGAGIQADLKTCTALGVFSTSTVTAVTVQNTLGVHSIHAIPVNDIADQITCVLDDIGTDVVKTGMLATEAIIEKVATVLATRHLPLVVDPVMVATSGDRLLHTAAHQTLVNKLFPLATIITPNIPETSVLLHDRAIESIEDMKQAARDLAVFGPAFVLIKGGHLMAPDDKVHDVLFDVEADTIHVITNRKLVTRNTHGTGCTLAAAIAAQYAKTGNMVQAVQRAIAYLHTVLVESQSLAIGAGDQGPMLHTAYYCKR